MFQWDIALCHLRAIAKAPKAPKAHKLPMQQKAAKAAKAAKAVGLFPSKSLKTFACLLQAGKRTWAKVSCPHRLALAGVAVGTMQGFCPHSCTASRRLVVSLTVLYAKECDGEPNKRTASLLHCFTVSIFPFLVPMLTQFTILSCNLLKILFY